MVELLLNILKALNSLLTVGWRRSYPLVPLLSSSFKEVATSNLQSRYAMFKMSQSRWLFSKPLAKMDR